MKPRSLLTLLVALALAWGTASCGRIELPDADTTGTDDGGGKGGDDGTGTVTADVISVAALSGVSSGSLVSVKGYIVGFVNGTSYKQTVFGTDDAKNSNIVIADRADESDCSLCAPVQLKQSSDAREYLNLLDNPEMLGTAVIVTGTKGEYMRSNLGIKNVETYEPADDDDDGDDDDTPAQSLTLPTLSEEAEVFEGA